MSQVIFANAHPLLQQAYTQAKAEWIAAHPQGPKPFLTCVCRTGKEQDLLFHQPEHGLPHVTNARAGQSPHNYSPALALDVCFTDGVKDLWEEHWYREFAPYMKKTPGISWGGDWQSFKDLPHFEVSTWKVLAKTTKIA